ncbi:hypothetical protein NDN08_008247 [Rhodosorus marinus]|uniref:Serine aminopeptidase S33 domain-containing protein n=1 Tax=Rhodosorus marinus TaxID=101924 RepID=A0AAV8V3N5_9RHOD|nr:hypothetical protein NDN08_008247 [Rhodosorus marinus]
MAFLISGSSCQPGAGRTRICMSEGSEGTDGMSKKEKREQLARERQERIREKRRKRLEELAEREGAAPLGTASVQKNESETADGMAMPKGNYGEDAAGLFGWVNQNPSSKNAVYMPAFKGDGGNTGEMVRQIRGRGKTGEGMEVTIKMPKTELQIYIRKVGTQKSNLAPIVLVHGLLANSWCYKELLDELEKTGREAYAFDFPGCGYSTWPQPGVGFSFTQEDITEVFEKVLSSLELEAREPIVVTQGYVHNQYINLWATKNPDRISKLVLLNQPLSPKSKLPFVLQQYKLPLVAPFVAQDAVRAERFLEGGGPYQMTVDDAARYREPFLESMMPGLGLIDAMKNIDFNGNLQQVVDGAAKMRDKVAIVWGSSDKYLDISEGREFSKLSGAKFREIDNAGFMVQSDWPSRVADFLREL